MCCRAVPRAHPPLGWVPPYSPLGMGSPPGPAVGGKQSFPQAIGGPGINVLLCGRSQSQRCSHLNIKSEPEPV